MKNNSDLIDVINYILEHENEDFVEWIPEFADPEFLKDNMTPVKNCTEKEWLKYFERWNKMEDEESLPLHTDGHVYCSALRLYKQLYDETNKKEK